MNIGELVNGAGVGDYIYIELDSKKGFQEFEIIGYEDNTGCLKELVNGYLPDDLVIRLKEVK